MNYFAIECNGNCREHVAIKDSNGNLVFGNYLNMSYDEMKNQDDLEEFIIAIMSAADVRGNQTIITLIGEDDVFIWSIIMGVIDEDLRYILIDWQKNGEKYRYEPLDK